VSGTITVLFLCTGNSCRSQMAEGWARYLRGETIDAYSAGTVAKGLNRKAVAVMREAGVDIATQRSQTLQDVLDAGVEPDLVVTVCGHAHEHCPHFPAGRTRVVHVGFDDPPALERDARDEDEALAHYRRVRDEIRDFVAGLPGNLPQGRPE